MLPIHGDVSVVYPEIFRWNSECISASDGRDIRADPKCTVGPRDWKPVTELPRRRVTTVRLRMRARATTTRSLRVCERPAYHHQTCEGTFGAGPRSQSQTRRRRDHPLRDLGPQREVQVLERAKVTKHSEGSPVNTRPRTQKTAETVVLKSSANDALVVPRACTG